MNRMERVLLNDMTKLALFVRQVSGICADVDVIKGRYVIDAKSIMGLLSLDLSTPMYLQLHTDDASDVEKFNNIIAEYGVKDN